MSLRNKDFCCLALSQLRQALSFVPMAFDGFDRGRFAEVVCTQLRETFSIHSDRRVSAQSYIHFKSSQLASRLGEEVPNTFQDGDCDGHVGYSMGIILAIFELHITPLRPITFPGNWPFGSGEVQNRFSR